MARKERKYAIVKGRKGYVRKGYHRRGYHRKGYYIHRNGKRIWIPPTYVKPTFVSRTRVKPRKKPYKMKIWHLEPNQKPVHPHPGRKPEKR